MQLFLHMVGDYVTQNNWLAVNKVKNSLTGYIACFIHSLIYSLPFLFIGSIYAVCVIFITHFLIDKYRLAKYIIQFKNWNFKSATGFPDDVPAFIAVWILFIVDNIVHVGINYLSIVYL